jgi:predicted nucleic acid-binding protein
LFSLDDVQQKKIYLQWQNLARMLDDQSLNKAPWACNDPDDQVFLDLAYTVKPCTLISKDNEVLRFANKAATEQVSITADYTVFDL